MKTIVKNFVREFRTKNKITQEELVKEIGVTRQTIIAIEKGNYTPSVLLALKIAQYFKTSVDTLFVIEEK
jgi:putative transcriptional regulator